METFVEQQLSGCVHLGREARGEGEEDAATPVAVLVSLPTCDVVLARPCPTLEGGEREGGREGGREGVREMH